jgi:hypothetical protein
MKKVAIAVAGGALVAAVGVALGIMPQLRGYLLPEAWWPL